jgi:hypothetical protein
MDAPLHFSIPCEDCLGSFSVALPLYTVPPQPILNILPVNLSDYSTSPSLTSSTIRPNPHQSPHQTHQRFPTCCHPFISNASTFSPSLLLTSTIIVPAFNRRQHNSVKSATLPSSLMLNTSRTITGSSNQSTFCDSSVTPFVRSFYPSDATESRRKDSRGVWRSGNPTDVFDGAFSSCCVYLFESAVFIEYVVCENERRTFLFGFFSIRIILGSRE